MVHAAVCLISPPEISCLLLHDDDECAVSSSPWELRAHPLVCNKVIFHEIETTKDQNNGNVQFMHEVFGSLHPIKSLIPNHEKHTCCSTQPAGANISTAICARKSSQGKERAEWALIQSRHFRAPACFCCPSWP
jgi:hypothetical protein